MDCPLCECTATTPYQPELADAFRECPDCRLVFLEPECGSPGCVAVKQLEHRFPGLAM